jgi:uncharacterized protein (DUF885 family)
MQRARFVWALACSSALLACERADVTPESDPEGVAAIERFFADFTAEWVRNNPDLAVATRYFQGEEQAALDRQLTPRTRAWRLQRIALARRGLAELADFEVASLSDAQRVSAEVMRLQLQTIVDEEPFLDYQFPLEQMNGANVDLPDALTVTHPLASEQDARSYVSRLGQVAERMREAIAEAGRLEAAGFLPPRFIVETTIAQMEQFVEPAPEENPLVTTLATKAAAVTGIGEPLRDSLVRDAARIVSADVYPAWREAIATLRRQLPATTNAAGIGRLPGGDEAYGYALARYTTTDLSAEEIHAIGLREVARIEAEMDTLLEEVGLAEGTIAERVAELKRRLAYSVDAEGRARIMSDIEDILADALRRSDELFGVMPRSPVVARPFPEFTWATAAASYTAPPLDGSRPGLFQMPLRPDQLTRFGLRSLVYHETVPGHHFQIALANEDATLPRFRQIRAFGTISATTEGWALYAEHLAAEAGWYEGDVEGRIGQLDNQLFRARRLVVDTGIHAMGWTRQQALDYGIDEPSEVDRYVVWPGQACSYMIGQLRIIELRERAREAWGPRFSLAEFHDVGPRPRIGPAGRARERDRALARPRAPRLTRPRLQAGSVSGDRPKAAATCSTAGRCDSCARKQ